MELCGQRPWYLCEIPSYAKTSEGYPSMAKFARASMLRYVKDWAMFCLFMLWYSLWSSAQADKARVVAQGIKGHSVL